MVSRWCSSVAIPRTMCAVVVALVVGIGLTVSSPAFASDPVTVTGEYVEYENSDGWPNIGPFVDLRDLFHAASLGPAGVACSAETVDVLQNEVAFTFVPDGGPVTGTGVLELTCEYHPGCGAVTRSIEASYLGEYDASLKLMTGTVEFRTQDGESTNWGNPDEQEHCLERWIKPGQMAVAEWLLDLGDSTATGYITASVEAGDPAKRFGYITVSAPGLSEPSDTDTATGGNDEAPVEEAGSRSDEAIADDGGESGEGVTLSFIALLVGLMLGGLALALFIGYIVRRQMGWGRHAALVDSASAERLVHEPSDPMTPGSQELDLLGNIEGPDADKVDVPPVTTTSSSPSVDAPVSWEPDPVAEQHLTESFLGLAAGTMSQTPPSSPPPMDSLKEGRHWVWVPSPTEVSYYEGGLNDKTEVTETLQPERWYQASARNWNDSCTVWSEDGDKMLGDKVQEVRFASTHETQPKPPP